MAIVFRDKKNNFVLLSELERRLHLFEVAHPTKTLTASEYLVIAPLMSRPLEFCVEAYMKFDHIRYNAIMSYAKGILDARKPILSLYENSGGESQAVRNALEEYMYSDDEELCEACCVMEMLNRVVVI